MYSYTMTFGIGVEFDDNKIAKKHSVGDHLIILHYIPELSYFEISVVTCTSSKPPKPCESPSKKWQLKSSILTLRAFSSSKPTDLGKLLNLKCFGHFGGTLPWCYFSVGNFPIDGLLVAMKLASTANWRTEKPSKDCIQRFIIGHQPKQCTIIREIHQNDETFAFLDRWPSQKMGNI